MPKAKLKSKTTQRVVRRDRDTRPRWTVIHPDGEELGLLPVTFVSEKLARESARLWNKQVKGHRVIASNAAMSDCAGGKLKS